MALVTYKDPTSTGADVWVTPSTPLPVTAQAAPNSDAAAGTSLVGVGNYVWGGAGWIRVYSAGQFGDGQSLSAALPAGLWAYDQGSANWNRVRTSALGTTDDVSSAFAGFSGLVVNSYARVYGSGGYNRQRIPDKVINIPATAFTVAGHTSILTPTSGKKFRLMAYTLSISAAASVIFEFAASTEFLRTPLAAAAGIVDMSFPNQGIMPGAANDPLRISVTANATVSGHIWYMEE